MFYAGRVFLSMPLKTRCDECIDLSHLTEQKNPFDYMAPHHPSWGVGAIRIMNQYKLYCAPSSKNVLE